MSNLSAYDKPLSKIYSMDFSRSGNLLVAGGHGGHVSVFGLLPSRPSLQSDKKDNNNNNNNNIKDEVRI